MRTLNFKVTRFTPSNVWVSNGPRTVVFPRHQIESWNASSVTFFNPRNARNALAMLSITDKEIEANFNKAKNNCVTCGGSGFFYAGPEKMPCSHGLSVTQRTFKGSVH